MKRRWRIALWVGVPLAIVGGTALATHFRLKAATEEFKAQLRAKDEKLTIAELIPSYSVDAFKGGQEFTAVRAGLQPIGYELTPGAMKMIKPGRARIAWKQAILAKGTNANIWPDLQANVQQGEPTASEVREILRRTSLRFPVDYSSGFDGFAFAHLGPMKSTEQWFLAAELSQLQAGRAEQAFDNLRALVALPVRYEPERFIISHLVRNALVAIAVSGTWEALQYPGWREEQLAELQGLWESLDIFRDFSPAQEMERARALIEYGRARQSLDRLNQLLSVGTSTPLDELAEAGQQLLNDPKEGINTLLNLFPRRWAWKWWTSYEDELWFLKFRQMHIDMGREATAGRAFVPMLKELANHVEVLGGPAPAYLVADAFGSGVYTKFFERVAIAETQRRIVVTAIAIKRYEARHGKLPAELSAVIPEFAAAIPIDPMDGQSLRYRATGKEQFLLYSIGLDGKDDGGDPHPKNSSSQSLYWTWSCVDWVWPQPATEEEVREYNLEQEKKARPRRNRQASPKGE